MCVYYEDLMLSHVNNINVRDGVPLPREQCDTRCLLDNVSHHQIVLGSAQKAVSPAAVLPRCAEKIPVSNFREASLFLPQIFLTRLIQSWTEGVHVWRQPSVSCVLVATAAFASCCEHQ